MRTNNHVKRSKIQDALDLLNDAAQEKKNIKEAPSAEDWEGGGSRPQLEGDPAGVRDEKKQGKNLKSDAQRRQKAKSAKPERSRP